VKQHGIPDDPDRPHTARLHTAPGVVADVTSDPPNRSRGIRAEVDEAADAFRQLAVSLLPVLAELADLAPQLIQPRVRCRYGTNELGVGGERFARGPVRLGAAERAIATCRTRWLRSVRDSARKEWPFGAVRLI